MTIHDQLTAELQRLTGFAGPGTVAATAVVPDGTTVYADLEAVDSLGCSVEQVRADVPKLTNANFDVLKVWGEALCRRVGYLLETLAELELDEQAGQVLIRSNPPDRQTGSTFFYEVLLRRDANGAFCLRRYEARQGLPGRLPAAMHLTHEVLKRLARDLVETIPSGP